MGYSTRPPIDALFAIARANDWRVGIVGLTDGSKSLETDQTLIALEVRQQHFDGPGLKKWAELELVATYPLVKPDVDVPIFVAAAGLVEAFREAGHRDAF